MVLCSTSAIVCGAGCGDDAATDWNPGDTSTTSPDAATSGDASAGQDTGAGGSGGGAAGGGSGGGVADAGPPQDGSVPDADAGPPPVPDPIAPCAAGKCWQTELWPNACSFATNDEDFSSGKYNVHAYATRVHGGSEMNLSLTNTGGTWQPALVLAKQDGTVVYDGDTGLVEPGMTVTTVVDGKTGGTAHFKVESATTWDGTLFVTSWGAIGSGFAEMLPTTATYHLETESVCAPSQPGEGTAPPGAVSGEQALGGGQVSVSTSTAQGTAYRVDAKKGEHIGFRYDFTPTGADVVMEVLRWNGTAAVSMAKTDSGTGLRVLATLDSEGDRTFWVRLYGATSTGTLEAKRTPFEEGIHCNSDCERLLQFPLPIETTREGYDLSGATYREQFGRRDLLMFTRYAGRAVAAAKQQPFSIHDLSNWDGTAPGGHASHDGGKDVDYSIYTASGQPTWSPVCTWDAEKNCVPGTVKNFGAVHMARLLSAVVESERVQYAFLDDELRPLVISAAEGLVTQGELKASVIPLLKDALTHWPKHNDHVHVRVYVTAY